MTVTLSDIFLNCLYPGGRGRCSLGKHATVLLARGAETHNAADDSENSSDSSDCLVMDALTAVLDASGARETSSDASRPKRSRTPSAAYKPVTEKAVIATTRRR